MKEIGYGYPPRLGKTIVARHGSGVFLNGRFKRHKDRKTKTGLSWKQQNIEDAAKDSANREWKKLNIEKFVIVKRPEGIWRSEKCFDIQHGDVVCILSCWLLVLLWCRSPSICSLSFPLE